MKLRILLVVAFVNICSFVKCQIAYPAGEITDARDGKRYQTINIDNTTWLTENMKYETENAVIILNNEYGINTDGYYYPHEEASHVCPAEFRLPEEKDWEKYVELVLELKKVPKDSIEYFKIGKRKNRSKGMTAHIDQFNFFNDPNPLKLEVSGIIQGNKLVSDGAMSFWTRKGGTNDIKYHVHIESNSAYNHTHKHHIVTRKKKKRKFLVRCVKSIND